MFEAVFLSWLDVRWVLYNKHVTLSSSSREDLMSRAHAHFRYRLTQQYVHVRTTPVAP
jgi:hypothetical protein